MSPKIIWIEFHFYDHVYPLELCNCSPNPVLSSSKAIVIFQVFLIKATLDNHTNEEINMCTQATCRDIDCVYIGVGMNSLWSQHRYRRRFVLIHGRINARHVW